jgi:hypothetical protein
MRHRFHSICPYFAMFPEAFATEWIDKLTQPGDLILDPFGGRGTTALTAILSGRGVVSTDINAVAYCLMLAKTSATQLRSFDRRSWRSKGAAYPEFFLHAFHPSTLQQILYLRESLDWRATRSDSLIAALCLGSLHGDVSDAASYFSNQMPRTISTKPAYSVKFWKSRNLEPPLRDVFSILRAKAKYRYESTLPAGVSQIYNLDMRRLPSVREKFPGEIHTVITSPPYLDTTNFEEDQWLRLWFLGGPPSPSARRLSSDDRHSSESGYWAFIGDMWRMLGQILASDANVILRVGCRRTKPDVLAARIFAASKLTGRRAKLISTNVTEIKNSQIRAVNKSTLGCRCEIDCHIVLA